jgi:hypothetical protein
MKRLLILILVGVFPTNIIVCRRPKNVTVIVTFLFFPEFYSSSLKSCPSPTLTDEGYTPETFVFFISHGYQPLFKPGSLCNCKVFLYNHEHVFFHANKITGTCSHCYTEDVSSYFILHVVEWREYSLKHICFSCIVIRCFRQFTASNYCGFFVCSLLAFHIPAPGGCIKVDYYTDIQRAVRLIFHEGFVCRRDYYRDGMEVGERLAMTRNK